MQGYLANTLLKFLLSSVCLDVDYALNLIILKMVADAIHSKQSSEPVMYSELSNLHICIL